MTRQIQSTQHSHGVVAHQGIKADQGKSLLSSLSGQQAVKRIFARHWQFVKPADMGPLHGQQRPTFLLHNPTMNLCKRQIEIQLGQLQLDLDLPEVDHTAADLVFRVSDAACGSGGKTGELCQPPDQHIGVKKQAAAAQTSRNSSARGASKSAWVRILPSRPPGCRGAGAACVAESSSSASSAPTWICSSSDRHSSWCCSDGLMEVMVNCASAKVNSRWVEPASPPPADSATNKSGQWPAGAVSAKTSPLVTRAALEAFSQLLEPAGDIDLWPQVAKPQEVA